MPSAAAIAGIGANGLRWRYEVRLSDLSKIVGEINDSGPDVRGEELARTLHGIAKRTRKFLELKGIEADFPALEALQWLEGFDVSDVDMEAVNEALNDLWDFFDYERILVR